MQQHMQVPISLSSDPRWLDVDKGKRAEKKVKSEKMKNENANFGKTLGKTPSQDYLKFLDSYLPTTAFVQTERVCETKKKE